jgi:hypothetical protein
MSRDIVPARLQDRERNHSEREQREKVNGTPRSPGSDRVNEERASRDENHEQGPCPTDGSMRKRSLGGQKLHGAETDRREGESGVVLDDRRGVEQRGERHAAPGLTLEHAVDVTQRFLAVSLIALVIGVARLIHRFSDRLRLLAREIACLLFSGGDRPRRWLAMHGGEG